MASIQELDGILLSIGDQGLCPRIIHQIYMEGEENIPDKWRDSQIEWKRLHPNYKYVVWNRELCRSLIETHEPDFLEIYDNYSYEIQRIFSVKYAILKRYGGIYSGLDVVPLFNIESKITGCNSNIYLVKGDNEGISYSTSLIISKRNIPLWTNVLDKCKEPLPSWCKGKYCEVTLSTGVRLLTDVVNSYNEPICQLSESLFNPSSNSESKYLNEIQGGSWLCWDSIFIRLIFRYRIILIILLVLIVITLVILAYIGITKISL